MEIKSKCFLGDEKLNGDKGQMTCTRCTKLLALVLKHTPLEN